MFCASCGAELVPGGKFCGSCGTPVSGPTPPPAAPEPAADATIVRPVQPAAPVQPEPPVAAAPPAYVPPTPPPAAAPVAPPAYTPPPVQPTMPPPVAAAQPVAPQAPNPSVLATQRQIANILSWDWKGPLQVAGSMLGVSLVLSLIFAFATKPTGTSFSARAMLTYIASFWNGTFGASTTGGGDGYTFGFGTTPLTLTVVTLLVGIVVFRAATRHYSSGMSAIWFAVRAAFFTTIPLLIVSWAITMGSKDIEKYVSSESDHNWSDLGIRLFGSNEAGFAHVDGTSMGVSSTATFFFTLLLVVLTLSAVALLRTDWFTTGFFAKVRDFVVGPLRAFGWLLLGAVAIGLVFNVIVLGAYAIDHHSLTSATMGYDDNGNVLTGHLPLKFQDWMTLVGLGIAYAANAGLQALGFGSAVQLGSFGADGSEAHLLGFYAGSDQASFGVWFALALAPLLLVFVALKTLKAHGADSKAALRSVWTAPLGWLGLIPIVLVFANFAISGSNGDGVSSGLDILGGTFLIPTYFLIVMLLVAWFRGILTPAHFDGLKSFAAGVGQAAPGQQQGAPVQPPAYPGQPEGQQPPAAPPAYQPPAAPPAYQPPAAPPAYQPPQEPPTPAS